MVSKQWEKENDLSMMIAELNGAAKAIDRLSVGDKDIDDITYFIARSLERLENDCQKSLIEISQCLNGKESKTA